MGQAAIGEVKAIANCLEVLVSLGVRISFCPYWVTIYLYTGRSKLNNMEDFLLTLLIERKDRRKKEID